MIFSKLNYFNLPISFSFFCLKIDSLKLFLDILKSVHYWSVSSVQEKGGSPAQVVAWGMFHLYIHSSDCIGEQNGISAGHS